MAGIGSTLGGLVGLAGGPVGSAIGTVAGGVLEALPALIKTDAEKENEKRLKELRQRENLGVLGLTEAEKQSLYTAGTNQIGSQLQQAQAQARAVGAAGMASGAGMSQLQQAQFAEAQAKAAAGVSQNVEVQNIQRKRELEDEIQARVAAASQAKQEALQAGLGALTGGLAGMFEQANQTVAQQGKQPTQAEIQGFAKQMNLSTDDAAGLMSYIGRNPEASKYLEMLGGGKN